MLNKIIMICIFHTSKRIKRLNCCSFFYNKQLFFFLIYYVYRSKIVSFGFHILANSTTLTRTHLNEFAVIPLHHHNIIIIHDQGYIMYLDLFKARWNHPNFPQ
ncbi:hypothetical protein BD408DRAFT_63280 [Parasitella parasitica]|nr:hypothetical protein BD408DRAFT_63280 [Parasitella parasitica]